MNRLPRSRCMAMLLVLLGLAPLPARAEERLRMSTTTSTENSGLLSALLPPFEKKYGCKVDVVAVGTGKALKLIDFVTGPEGRSLIAGFKVDGEPIFFASGEGKKN